MKKTEFRHAVRDVIRVADAIDSRWRKHRQRWLGGWKYDLKYDADCIRREVNIPALERCIAYLLDEDATTGIRRGVAAAQRLDELLQFGRIDLEKKLAKGHANGRADLRV